MELQPHLIRLCCKVYLSIRRKVLGTCRWAAVFTAVLSCALPAAAQPSEEFQILYFGQKEGRIAFSYERNGQDDIYVLDFQSLSVTPLIRHPANDQQPRWSPDGRWLALTSNRTGKYQIYLLGEDDQEPIQITNLKGDSTSPDWSPDGGYIAFQSTQGSPGKNIFMMNADGSYPRQVTRTNKSNTVPRWSPRGTEILYSTNEYWPGWDLELYDVNAQSTKVLTKGVAGFCRGGWHPSGSIIALSYGIGSNVDIWLFQKGMDRIVPLIQQPGREYDAEWMDDGNKLLFVGEPEPGTGNYEMFVWERSTKKVHQLTKSPGSIRHPSWTALPSLRSVRQSVAESQGTSRP